MTEDPSHLTASIQRRLTDLTSFQIPRLAECAGPRSLQEELVSELRDDMDQVRRSIQALADLGEEMDSGPERQDVLTRARSALEQYERLRQSYRSALLTSNDLMRSSSRRQVIPSSSYQAGPSTAFTSTGSVMGEMTGKGQVAMDGRAVGAKDRLGGRRGHEDPLHVKTHEVTDALRRTVDTMQAELERSVLATQMLDESTQTLRSTQSLYDRYTSLLQTSTRLMRQLESADWYDRLTIFFALAFFCLVVASTVKRRVLDKAVRGVGWWVGGSYRLLTGGGVGRGKNKAIAQEGGKAAKALIERARDQVKDVANDAGRVLAATLAAGVPVDPIAGVGYGRPDAAPEGIVRGYRKRGPDEMRVEILPHQGFGKNGADQVGVDQKGNLMIKDEL